LKGSILPLLLGYLLLAPTSMSALTFSDGVFDPLDWSATVTGAGTASHQQVLTGGNGGSYLEVTNRPTPVATSTVAGFHLHSGFVYDPSVSGAIASIAWSVDVINLALGHAAGLAIAQGGSFMAADTFVTVPLGSAGWIQTGPSLLLPGDLPAGLDLSPSGAPLTFGIFAANTFDPRAGDVDNIVGYDNLTVTVTSVPEPGSLVALGICLAVIVARRHAV
jgi:hypothetical protein